MVTVTYECIVKYMNSMEFSGMNLGLERIKQALELFDNPDKKLKIIHVVGTNGKGSVTAMTTKILQEAGYKVGMFTSPHLIDVRERIQINGEMISKDEFRDMFLEAKSKLAELTFFELLTLMSVLYFVKKNVDYAVFEAGLGGTYDSTNFETSLLSVITKISLDHTNILGKTIEDITKDKSGIIKQNQTVITTEGNRAVMHLIENEATNKNASLVIVGDSEYKTAFNGQFQRQNAGIAVQIAKELGIDEEKIKKALLEVKWPGRMEYLEKNVLLDCAHNPAGIGVLKDYVETLEYEKLIIIFAVSKNKDYKRMLNLLPNYDELIFTQTSIARRLPIDDAPVDLKCTKIIDPVKALEHAKSLAGEKDLIVMCGSIFLIADVKSALVR